MSALKEQLTNAMKEAMRAKDQHRLTVIRMALASLKQVEVDERIELDDARVLAILDKQIKQRIDASTQCHRYIHKTARHVIDHLVDTTSTGVNNGRSADRS